MVEIYDVACISEEVLADSEVLSSSVGTAPKSDMF